MVHVPVSDHPLTLAILGAGAWGSALAKLAHYNGHTVQIWSRHLGNSLAESINSIDVLVSAVSMTGVTPTIEQLQTLKLSDQIPIVTATKGLDPHSTRTPSQLWGMGFPDHPIVVLSGPNLSAEIEQGLPAATVVASEDLEAAKIVQRVFASNRFRVYTSFPIRWGQN